MQNEMHFTYTLYLVPDGRYGMEVWKDNVTEWNGLVREILDQVSFWGPLRTFGKWRWTLHDLASHP